MTIDASFVEDRCRLLGILTTVTQSDDVDDMNRPLDVTTQTRVRFWWHPETAAEVTGTRPVAMTRMVTYFPASTSVNESSRLTYDGAAYEFDGPPLAWVHPLTGQSVGIVGHVVRTT